MSLRSELHSYGEAFLRLMFPATCGICPQVLELDEAGICTPCKKHLEESRFALSDRMLDVNLPWIREAFSFYPYEFPVKDILQAIKFLKKRWLLRLFHEDLNDYAEMFKLVSSYQMIVPIPIDSSHLMNRHYNQTEILAQELSNKLKAPMNLCLQKKRSTPAQIRLHQKDRMINLRGAFTISKPGICLEKNILLVDDVLTTGATASEAAKTLRENGARNVDLLTIAHTRVHHFQPTSLQEST